jgi:hypothetical protein
LISRNYVGNNLSSKQSKIGSEYNLFGKNKSPEEDESDYRLFDQKSYFKDARIDNSSSYYRTHFYRQDHFTFVAIDKNNEDNYYVISIKKEALEDDPNSHQYRIIYRSKNQSNDLYATISSALIKGGSSFLRKSAWKEAILLGTSKGIVLS